MFCVLLAKEIFDIQRGPFVRIQRLDALIYFGTERVELLDMREQSATDLLLIGSRQSGNLRNGLFECFEH